MRHYKKYVNNYLTNPSLTYSHCFYFYYYALNYAHHTLYFLHKHPAYILASSSPTNMVFFIASPTHPIIHTHPYTYISSYHMSAMHVSILHTLISRNSLLFFLKKIDPFIDRYTFMLYKSPPHYNIYIYIYIYIYIILYIYIIIGIHF